MRLLIVGWVIGPIIHNASPLWHVLPQALSDRRTLNEVVLWFPCAVVVRIVFPLDEILSCAFGCTTSIENLLNFVRRKSVWVFIIKFELRGRKVATNQ
ncbi:MAG: hypothetical protein J3R72DRAFT_464843 [Linnemannia gamsii]|nr:MAG: hypothetical protein J3R72DRAFT_464843 [Linnemannia gamsii]